MPLALILLLQAAAAPAAASPVWDAIDFDLARYRPDGDDGDFAIRACPRGADHAAIVVCGRRGGGGAGAYPMAAMERRYGPRPLIAETGVAGDLRADIHVEAAPMDRGAVSNRVMIGLKLPF